MNRFISFLPWLLLGLLVTTLTFYLVEDLIGDRIGLAVAVGAGVFVGALPDSRQDASGRWDVKRAFSAGLFAGLGISLVRAIEWLVT